MSRLPQLADLRLDPRKVTEYLLSATHEQGRSKCEFFERFGFSRAQPQELLAALCRHPAMREVTRTQETDFGTRYWVECAIESPDGRNPCIRTIWQAEPEGGMKFITAIVAQP